MKIHHNQCVLSIRNYFLVILIYSYVSMFFKIFMFEKHDIYRETSKWNVNKSLYSTDFTKTQVGIYSMNIIKNRTSMLPRYNSYTNVNRSRKIVYKGQVLKNHTKVNKIQYGYQYIPKNKEEINFYTPSKIKVNPFMHTFVIHNKYLCSNNTHIIILVNSFIGNIDRRQAIRQTWGSVADGNQWPGVHIQQKINLAFVIVNTMDLIGKRIYIVKQKHTTILSRVTLMILILI